MAFSMTFRPFRPGERRSAFLARERSRLRAHFREVLAELRSRDVSHLTAAQRAMRARLIEELARYARTGRFPRNTGFPGGRVPYFVDPFGTRCAMAHLIESTGETALVARVAATMNNALVRDLEADASLQAWLATAGLTAAEAARIQPSYCFENKAFACFCTSYSSSDGVVEGTVVDAGGGSYVVKVEVIHGDVQAMVGQEIEVEDSNAAEVGDSVLVTIGHNVQNEEFYGRLLKVEEDGTIPLSCALDIPALKKEDAILATLAKESRSCEDTLVSVDSKWDESQCEDGGGGCATSAARAGSGLLLGTALVGAAVWARRRAKRRRSRPERLPGEATGDRGN
jgi:hypothetical protein